MTTIEINLGGEKSLRLEIGEGLNLNIEQHTVRIERSADYAHVWNNTIITRLLAPNPIAEDQPYITWNTTNVTNNYLDDENAKKLVGK